MWSISLHSLKRKGLKFYLDTFHPAHPHLCGRQDMHLWFITLSRASRQIPTPKPLPAILIALLSPPFSPSLCFLDLEEPLILHSDSACLNHTQPFLEPDQREHLQVFVKIVEPCSLNNVQMYNKETCMPCLISPFFFVIGGKYWKRKRTGKNLYQVNLNARASPFPLSNGTDYFLKTKDKFLCNDK